MKKDFLLLIFLVNTALFAQSKMNETISFGSNNNVTNYQFSTKDNYIVDYKKYLNFPVQFSIYNPKPGFNPNKIESQKYYSFTHTNSLLKREMSNLDLEPHPTLGKKKTLGEAIFHDAMEGIFHKKSK
jgi:hypothetical protein